MQESLIPQESLSTKDWNKLHKVVGNACLKVRSDEDIHILVSHFFNSYSESGRLDETADPF